MISSLFIREEALCAQSNPELWFEEKTKLAREAISICSQCPAMEECRQFAIDNEIDYGIWGGNDHGAASPRTQDCQAEETGI